MQKNRWSQKFDWIKSGTTNNFIYIQQSRLEKYDENRFLAVGDIYFKLNKYLTGVTFTYINSLNDIYKKDLLTGDGYSIVNMYNEYDVIDRVLKNIIFVDIAADIHIDINKQWFEINDVKLKPGHLILLKSQNSWYESENDIYVVDNNYFLNVSNVLSTRQKSEKFSCSVKLGKNTDKQFFLVNNGNSFPISYESKYFIEGQSFLLKNLIRYNVYCTSTGATTSRMIFTDYDFARKQIINSSEYFYDFTANFLTGLTLNNYLTINYHHDLYSIRSGTSLGCIFTGLTSEIRNNITGITIIEAQSYNTKFETSAIPFPSYFEYNIGDHILLNMYSGSSNVLIFDSYIKIIQDNYLVLEESIPNKILNELKYTTFIVKNLNVAYDRPDVIYKLNYTPYSDFFSFNFYPITGITEFLTIATKENTYNKYFDYDGLTFYFDDDSIIEKFSTDYQYLKYNLFERLNQIYSGFTSGFSFFNEYLLSDFNYTYTENYKRIRLFNFPVTGITSIFKPYTYVNLSGDTLEKTLIYEVNNDDIIIEKPVQWTSFESPIKSIQNIDGLKNISDILYEVYMNDTYDWYIQKNDNVRKYISKSYAELLTLNELFRDNVSGILFENENNEFILKLYNLGPEGTIDSNLFFAPIELIYLGADRKTRLPVPLKLIEGIATTTTTTTLLPTTTTTTTILTGTTTTTTTRPTTTTTTVAPTTTTTTIVPITTTTTTVTPTTTTTTTTTVTPTTTTTTTSVITTTTTTTTGLTTTTTAAPITTTTTTIASTTTTTSVVPVTTTTTTTGASTTTTTVGPITTTTTTIVEIIYYGISSATTVTEVDILSGTTFLVTTGYVGLVTGRDYIFPSGYSYKYWCIPNLPNTIERVIKSITHDNGINTVLVYNSYYNNYQLNPTPDQPINYGILSINGISYRIYRTILISSSQLEHTVFSF